MYRSPVLIESLTNLIERALLTCPDQKRAREKARRVVGTLLPLDSDQFTDSCLRAALHLNLLSWTGMLSLQFCKLVREFDPPSDLYTWTAKEFSPELYLCPRLSQSEKREVRRRVEEEMDVMRADFTGKLPELVPDPLTEELNLTLPLLLVAADRNLNPNTGESFPPEMLERVRQRFWLELKLIRPEREKKKLRW